MLKKGLFSGLILVLFSFFVFFSSIKAQEKKEIQKVEYTLPYPGILTDNPLFLLKRVRDGLLIFLTRDPIKKADLWILVADKKIEMARLLAESKKWKFAADTALESERDFNNVLVMMSISKKKGAAAPEGFINKAKRSNRKHQEIIAFLLKRIPEGADRKVVEKAFRKNQTINKAL